MSKVVKGIKKVFKKVVKVVKKVAPIVLAAAAIYFTAGAAMGVTSAAGGWAGAASSISSSLGATGTLGNVLTGAITQAGYGAAIGGTISKVSGGKFSEGARKGAMVGAVTGGITGAFAPTTPSAGADTTGMNAADEAAAMGGNFSHETGMSSVSTATPPPITTQVGSGGGGAGSGGGGLMRQGGWLERNQALTGSLISGLGQGMMVRGEGDADIEAIREKHKLTSQNYGSSNPNTGYSDMAAGTSTQNPMQRFDPNSYGQFEYQYNPAKGRIERVARS